MAFPSCTYCGTPTDRLLGAWPCCNACRYGKVPHLAQRGEPGAIRLDHGPDQFDLTCGACGATWVGAAWERCYWCPRAHEALIDAQRTLVLSEPDIDIDWHEKELARCRDAWAARLVVAVEAGYVTKHEADMTVRAWIQKVEQWWP